MCGLESKVLLGFRLCVLVLGLLLVFHSWYRKLETHWVEHVRIYLFFTYSVYQRGG